MEVDPRWLDDAKTLKIVRGQRGYVHDVTIVAKIVALFERIAALEAEKRKLLDAALVPDHLELVPKGRIAELETEVRYVREAIHGATVKLDMTEQEARREGARDGIEYERRMHSPDDWKVATKDDIDNALGEVDGGK